MKILRVKFLNINSLRGEWEIDFSNGPLAETGLFAITGPTGSGKSSILDAITVALYSAVPRYGNDRPEQVMTRHTGESLSEVDFEVRGARYRSTWSIYRARKKPDGKIQPVHMALIDLDSDTAFDLKPSQVPIEIERITGLDKQRFMRSVMLAQGDFAAFLQAKEKERGELLEKITGLEIYSEISKAAYERMKNEEQKKLTFEQKIDSSKLLSPDARATLEEEIKTKQTDVAAQQKKLKQLHEKIQWLRAIENLKQEKATTLQRIEEIKNEQTEFDAELQRLKRHEKAQPLQADFREFETAAAHRVELQQTITLLAAALEKAASELQTKEAELAQARKAYAEFESQSDEFENTIKNVRQLDQDIAHQKGQWDAAVDEMQNMQTEHAALTHDLQNKQAQLTTLQNDIAQAEKWLAEHPHVEVFEKEWAGIVQRLDAIDQLRQEFAENRVQVNKMEQDFRNTDVEYRGNAQHLAQLKNKLESHKNQMSSAEAELAQLLADSSQEQLLKSLQQASGRREKAGQLQHLAIQFDTQNSQLKSIEEELQKQKKQQSDIEKGIIENNTKIVQQREHVEALRRIVEQNKLLQKYEADRPSLESGKPCPLCGATEHPYATNLPELALDEDAMKLTDAEKAFAELEKSDHALEIDAQKLGVAIEKIQERHESVQLHIQDISQQFEAINKALCGDFQITEQERIATFSGEIETQTKADEARLEKINRLENMLKIADKSASSLDRDLAALQEKTENQRLQLQRMQKDLSTQREKLEQKKAQGIEAAQRVGESLAQYGEQLPQHPEQRAEFEKHVTALFNQAKEIRDKETQQRQQLAGLQSQCVEFEKSVEEKTARITLQKDKCEALGFELKTLQKKRYDLFGDKECEAEIAQRKALGEKLGSGRDTAAELRQQAEIKRSSVQSEHKAESARLEKAEKNYATLDKNFHLKLEKFGIDSIETFRAALLTDSEIETIRARQTVLEKSLAMAQGQAEKIESDIKKMHDQKLTDQPEDTLKAEQIELEKCITTFNQEIGEIRSQLAFDEKLKNEHQQLTEELEKQKQVWQKWRRLAELIGSADGSKFSRYAQGLTLARLVQLANLHLVKLNDRYIIEKTTGSDLELEIVDRYQADTIRPMRSLSGGESFLVSLALALGLSDLASRKNRIDSLFIDEGFGTLDADTLETAISTLENLQAAGKSIGIISHVQALKERLTTQIQLTKQSGGVSTLKIVDGM